MQKVLDGGWSSVGPVLPVVAFSQLAVVEPVVEILLEAGFQAIEITLRTPVALAAIETCAKRFSQCKIGAGTILSKDDLRRVQEAGACYALSPGLLPELVSEANEKQLPFIPGVSTASEIMLGLSLGVTAFKFFPAIAMGGEQTLKAFQGPLVKATFCPTGGVDQGNAAALLALPNVFAVGMSRILDADCVARGDWQGLKFHVRSIAQLLKVGKV